MIKVGIIGSTGYVGHELLRILTNHKKVKIAQISSYSYEGQSIDSIYGNLNKISSLMCTNPEKVIASSDLVFTALPHGLSEEIAEKCLEKDKICIDLGADFRLKDEEEYSKWYGKNFSKPHIHPLSVYGLPELNREKIRTSPIIANPGCYPTSIELALMPVLREKLIDTKSIVIDSKSGTTGAGRGLSQTTHFPECNENILPYKIGEHRHLPEIQQILSEMANTSVKVTFVPHLLPVNRGILSTIYCTLNETKDVGKVHNIYKNYYEKEAFVRVLEIGKTASIRNVKYSNFCDISLHMDVENSKLIIVSAIDNMVKGAAGQAIQNMNIVLGIDEGEGLNFIPPAF
ncbi:MAG: N-acetyl-gamma-glutamyl-phosphate reductase [Lutispora sp.]|nr:N-acetyl-gamma-glutamyl-phosphate reductase [Lutispora sp.]